MNEEEKDYEAFKTYLELWKSENPIKTNKLQVLFIVNGLLVSVMQLAGGFKPENWFLYLAGGLFSIVWVLSIGRTSLYQKVWQIKAKTLSEKYQNDPRFCVFNTEIAGKEAPVWLRALGNISSRYYLLGAPLLFSFLWFSALIYVLISN